MFPATPAAVRPRSVCLVASDGRGLNERVAELRKTGHTVHILHDTTSTAIPPAFRVRNLYETGLDASDRVRVVLESLHERHHFDAIEFPVRGGAGFRCVQAKAAGLAFEAVALVARLDGCSSWDREQAQRWPNGFAEVERDFAERVSYELADERVTPSAAIQEHVRRLGWDSSPAPAPHLDDSDRLPLVTIAIAHYNLGRYLPATLESLAAQTYQNLEVIVIDDGSTEPESLETLAAMQARYPLWRFLRQANAGIGATRNRCLSEARGEYFIPVDADNLARPNMVEAFVRGLQRNPHLAAMTCYFLGFETPGEFLYACRPAGGPHPLAALRNVYGDANAIFRTTALRGVGGYETDRGTSCEDWEAFVKLIHGGYQLGVVPDHLFEYRHRPGGFSRATNWYANHQRVLRQFTGTDVLPPGSAAVLWTALLGFHQELERRSLPRPLLRHRVANRLRQALGRVPRLWRRGSTATRRGEEEKQ